MSVVVASLELDIRLVEDCMARVMGTLKKGVERPEEQGQLQRQLEELAAEKAQYKERKLALLEKIVPHQPSHKRSLSLPRRLSSLANVVAPGDDCIVFFLREDLFVCGRVSHLRVPSELIASRARTVQGTQ